jgi:hypothetical protein
MGVIIGLYNYTPAPPPPPSLTVPTVTTTTLTDVKSMSALGGGNVTNDGGATVTARGICWSTSPNPTIADSTTSNGTGTGAFSSTMRVLDPSVTYYIRAYATNSQGTGYGAQQTIITRAFRIVKINKFDTRVNVPSAVNDILTSVNNHGFNWLQLYDLSTIFGSSTLRTALATFISKSRAAGVERIGAIRSLDQTKWNQVLSWNTTHPWYEQFDDFNVENEFWWWPLSSNNPNNPPSPIRFPDSDDFPTWSSSVAVLKNTLDGPTYNRGNAYIAAGGKPWIISAYLNNYDAGSGQWENDQATGSVLASLIDVWEATNYNSNAPDAARLGVGGSRPQLQYLASGAFDLGVTRSFVPLYSLEEIAWGAETDLSGYYFQSVGLVNGETTWDNTYNTSVRPNIPYRNNIKLIGHNYFSYSYVTRSVGV